MGLFVLIPLSSLFASSASVSRSEELSPKVRVCYGQLGLGNNLPKPSKSIHLLKKLKAKQVKIYKGNPKILKGTDLRVSIMVPDEIITNISSNHTLADQWVQIHVMPFYPRTLIRYTLKKFDLKKIKVGTPSAMDILESSFPHLPMALSGALIGKFYHRDSRMESDSCSTFWTTQFHFRMKLCGSKCAT